MVQKGRGRHTICTDMQFAVTGKLIPQLTATLLEIKYFPDELVMASFVAAWAVGAFIFFFVRLQMSREEINRLHRPHSGPDRCSPRFRI